MVRPGLYRTTLNHKGLNMIRVKGSRNPDLTNLHVSVSVSIGKQVLVIVEPRDDNGEVAGPTRSISLEGTDYAEVVNDRVLKRKIIAAMKLEDDNA